MNRKSRRETGLAGATVNMTSAEIIELLGPPDCDFAFNQEFQYYRVAGFYFDERGRVDEIKQHAYVQTAFPPTNLGRIGVSSSKEAVLAAYGKPDKSEKAKRPNTVASWFEYKKDPSVPGDVSLVINFFENETVHSIFIYR